MEKKTNLTTDAVAWSNDKPTMYQTRLSHRLKNGRTISIYGDPARSKEQAKWSAINELSAWKEAIEAFARITQKE